MKEVLLDCPKCWCRFTYPNKIQWILHSPFHWFNRRLTKCPACGHKSWIKRAKS